MSQCPARPLPQPPDFAFYADVLERLRAHHIPFLVGGGYAFQQHTGIERHTRDFDVFVLPEHAPHALGRLAAEGYRTCMTFTHWLGKVVKGDDYVDVIFSSGNGVARVDRVWFDHAEPAEMFGHEVWLCPPEEMIWSKAFIMERERFDGADIIHLIHARAERLDWTRLMSRFRSHGRVLLAHLILYGFVYPQERDRVPREVMARLVAELDRPDREASGHPVCRGTLLSRSQYLPDLERGYHDPRLIPEGTMSAGEIEEWTAAADEPAPADRDFRGGSDRDVPPRTGSR